MRIVADLNSVCRCAAELDLHLLTRQNYDLGKKRAGISDAQSPLSVSQTFSLCFSPVSIVGIFISVDQFTRYYPSRNYHLTKKPYPLGVAGI